MLYIHIKETKKRNVYRTKNRPFLRTFNYCIIRTGWWNSLFAFFSCLRFICCSDSINVLWTCEKNINSLNICQAWCLKLCFILLTLRKFRFISLVWKMYNCTARRIINVSVKETLYLNHVVDSIFHRCENVFNLFRLFPLERRMSVCHGHSTSLLGNPRGLDQTKTSELLRLLA